MSFDVDTAACAALTRKSDPDRFAATMALPVPLREKLFPLWAFNIEVARAPWVTREPLIAEMRLQWWRDALDEIAAGGLIRRHEVVTPLALTISPPQAETLMALVEARRSDIETAPFADEAALQAYLEATSAGLFWTAARVLGAPDSEEAAVRQVGRAVGMANWYHALPELEARGKRPMPDGRPETLVRLAEAALKDLSAQKGLTRAARYALLSGYMARRILSQSTRRPADIAAGRLQAPPLTRSLRLIAARLTGRI